MLEEHCKKNKELYDFRVNDKIIYVCIYFRKWFHQQRISNKELPKSTDMQCQPIRLILNQPTSYWFFLLTWSFEGLTSVRLENKERTWWP